MRELPELNVGDKVFRFFRVGKLYNTRPKTKEITHYTTEIEIEKKTDKYIYCSDGGKYSIADGKGSKSHAYILTYEMAVDKIIDCVKHGEEVISKLN